jgi:cytoskeleton protein RodZ
MTGNGNSGAPEHRGAPGVALRAARTAQNLSLGEVARQLRLSVAQVEALEANAFERLPGPVFVRGFIRNYARLLRLDPDELLRHLVPATAPEQEPTPAEAVRAESFPARRRALWPWLVFAGIVLIVALAVYEFVFNESQRTGASKVSDGVTLPVPAATRVEEVPAPPPAVAVGTIGEAQADAPAAPPAVAPEAEIRMRFDRDSWVEIRDQSGRTIFSQLNRSGSEQRVRGRPPLVVVIGNARGVRLTYNDRAVDLSQYTRYDVARLTLE